MKLDEITDIKVCLVEFCEIVDYLSLDVEERTVLFSIEDRMRDYIKLLEKIRLEEIT